MDRADKGDLYDESKLEWSGISMVGEDPCWICATEKMTNHHTQLNPHTSNVPLWSLNVDGLGPFRAVGLNGEKSVLVFADAGSNLNVVEPVIKRVDYYVKLPMVVNSLNALNPKPSYGNFRG